MSCQIDPTADTSSSQTTSGGTRQVSCRCRRQLLSEYKPFNHNVEVDINPPRSRRLQGQLALFDIQDFTYRKQLGQRLKAMAAGEQGASDSVLWNLFCEN